jgi:hypothetical protein
MQAFDTVSVFILVHKLEYIDIRGTPLALFKSYLSERKQKVKLPGFVSGDAELSSFGVPQGSVLVTHHIFDLYQRPVQYDHTKC